MIEFIAGTVVGVLGMGIYGYLIMLGGELGDDDDK